VREPSRVVFESWLFRLGEFTGAGVWVANDAAGTASRIDPARDRVTASVPVGHAKPAWFAAAPDSLWVSSGGDNTVSRIDPATAKVTATVRTCKAPLDLGLAAGDVWVPCNGDGTLERIDPATARVTGTLRLKPGIFVAQEAFGDLWVLRYSSTQVWRIETTA
jgi:YVTN family beta-propeller protein